MKTLADTQNELKELIPEGIDVVVKALKNTLTEGTDKYNDLILIEGRYKDVTRQLIQGIISDEASKVTFNTIRKDLLTFIDNLQANHLKEAGGAGVDGKPDIHNGEVLYRIPKQMQKGKSSKCLVRLAFDRKVIMEDINPEKGDVLKDIRISEVMGVELIDPMEEAFEIKTLHDTVQFVEKDLFTEWIFFVKPILEGRHQLVLKISIIEIKNGVERKRNVVLEEEVKIVSTVIEESGVGKKELQSAGLVLAVSKTAHAKVAANANESTTKSANVKTTPAPKTGGAFTKMASIVSALAVLVVASVFVFSDGGEGGSDMPGPTLTDKQLSVIPSPSAGDEDYQGAETAWQDIKDEPSVEEVRGYLDKYPNEEFSNEAREALGNLENRSWELAQKSNDVEQLEDFLDTFPNGTHADEAKNLIADLDQLPTLDNENPADPNNPGSQDGQGKAPKAENGQQDADEKSAKPTPEVDPNRPISIWSTSRKPYFKGCQNDENKSEEEACTDRSIGDYIRDNLKYPTAAKTQGIEGTVKVQFIVEKDGKVTSVQYNNHVGGGCAIEAVQLIQRMPRFGPGLNGQGQPVRVRYKLPITFRLDK